MGVRQTAVLAFGIFSQTKGGFDELLEENGIDPEDLPGGLEFIALNCLDDEDYILGWYIDHDESLDGLKADWAYFITGGDEPKIFKEIQYS